MTASAQPSTTQRSDEVLTYRIRLARAEEVARLRKIEDEAATLFSGVGLIDEALDMSFPLEDLDRLIGIGQVWVACLDDESPVGMVIAAVREGDVYIEEMAVLPAHGRCGLGTRLLATVCAWAQAAGYPAVTLATFRDVSWNGPFYRKHGFRDLQPLEWTPGMRAIRDQEAEHGLRVDARVLCATILVSRAPPSRRLLTGQSTFQSAHCESHGGARDTTRRSGSTTTSLGSLS